MSWHPRGRVVEVGGRRVHCVDVGEGPPVLLLHGFLHSSWTWRATLEALSRRHRVLVPDLPGFGWSDREVADPSLLGYALWLQGLLDALGVRRVALAAGNSLGGGVLLHLALEDPARFERLVLVSTLGVTLRVPGLPLRLLGLRAFEPLFRATAGRAGFVRHALAWTAYKRIPVDDEVLAGFAPLGRPGSHAAALAVAGRLWTDSAALGRRLGEVTTPSLVVWGARDGVLPLRYGRAVAASLPDARLEVFEDCGHCAQEEDPARFGALLTAALAAPPDALRAAPAADGVVAPATA